MAKKSNARPRAGKSAGSARRAVKQSPKTSQKTKSAAAKPSPKKAKVTAKKSAAAPLLARAPKKTAKVVADISKAPYQPKTEPPHLQNASPVVAPAAPAIAKLPTAVDPLAVARPWMRLGVQMSMATIAMQAHMARAALELAPSAAAFRQGVNPFDVWRAFLGGVRPAPDAKS
jgi:hypothetical protein